jgi:hypothetical protein
LASELNFLAYPIIFLFETTIPFENKLGRNVPRIVIFSSFLYEFGSNFPEKIDIY